MRQTMRCGFELEPPPNLPCRAWSYGWSIEPTICPGYTTKLPEVAEASFARLHWSKGALALKTAGDAPTEATLVAIEILEIEAARRHEWTATPESQGGGRKE